jgi:hypothetical protein
LLILAGHLGGEPARAALRDVLDHAGPAITEAYEDDGAYLSELRETVDAADDEALIEYVRIGVTLPVREVDLPASLAALAPAAAPDGDLLTEIVAAWHDLSGERRWLLVQLTRDLRTASQHHTST